MYYNITLSNNTIYMKFFNSLLKICSRSIDNDKIEFLLIQEFLETITSNRDVEYCTYLYDKITNCNMIGRATTIN